MAVLDLDSALDEPERVSRWETLMLLDLNFSLEQTETLVGVPNFSWHDAKRLLDRGMPHELVVDQLA